MINIFLKSENNVQIIPDNVVPPQLNKSDVIWADVIVSPDMQSTILSDFKIKDIITADEEKIIGERHKFYESTKSLIINLTLLDLDDDEFINETFAFILTGDEILLTIRDKDCEIFTDTYSKISADKKDMALGSDIFLSILSSHINRESDIMEKIADKISNLSEVIKKTDRVDKEAIKNINTLQGKVTVFRETIFDLQRVLFSIESSKRFPNLKQPILQIMLQNVNSLISHAEFSFQRLNSIQDTALGLINIEQNEIMKILSVAAVVFMPPTLVASIYGMNFKYMPELDWAVTTSGGTIIPLGYIFAIFLMLLFSFLTIFFFKYKKWL